MRHFIPKSLLFAEAGSTSLPLTRTLGEPRKRSACATLSLSTRTSWFLDASLAGERFEPGLQRLVAWTSFEIEQLDLHFCPHRIFHSTPRHRKVIQDEGPAQVNNARGCERGRALDRRDPERASRGPLLTCRLAAIPLPVAPPRSRHADRATGPSEAGAGLGGRGLRFDRRYLGSGKAQGRPTAG
jgi:hypothetical protein